MFFVQEIQLYAHITWNGK